MFTQSTETIDPTLAQETPASQHVSQRGKEAVRPQSCGCGGSVEPTSGPHVYAIGDVEARFPTLGVEKEAAQVIAREGLSGTDARVLYEVLKKPHNRYLARRLCWVLRIEGFDTYLLKPEDQYGLEQLVEAIRPAEKSEDFDLVIGTRGQIAGPEYCNGLQVPFLTFEQLYSFEKDHFLSMIRGDRKDQTPEQRESDQALLQYILHLADNTGTDDEHRALNYLTVRYARMYQRVSERLSSNFQLAGIDVRPSRLSNDRRVMQVVFNFCNRTTDVTEKEFIRVDVHERYPFLVSPMQPYYDR